MSDKIKPSEVSEVLQQQLQEVNGSQQFDEVGTVLTVSDGVARMVCVMPRLMNFLSLRTEPWLSS